MGLKLVLLVDVINLTEAAVCSTNHMAGLVWLTSHSPRLPYRCILPRLQAPLKAIFVDERRETGSVGLDGLAAKRVLQHTPRFNKREAPGDKTAI